MLCVYLCDFCKSHFEYSLSDWLHFPQWSKPCLKMEGSFNFFSLSKNLWKSMRLCTYRKRKHFVICKYISTYLCKVHIFWEGHKSLRNLHRRFDWHYVGQIYGGDFTIIIKHFFRLIEGQQSTAPFSEFLRYVSVPNFFARIWAF